MRGKILSIELAKSVTPQLKVPNPNMVSNYGKTIKIGCMCYPKARVPPLVLLVYVDPHIGHAFLLKTLGTKNLLWVEMNQKIPLEFFLQSMKNGELFLHFIKNGFFLKLFHDCPHVYSINSPSSTSSKWDSWKLWGVGLCCSLSSSLKLLLLMLLSWTLCTWTWS